MPPSSTTMTPEEHPEWPRVQRLVYSFFDRLLKNEAETELQVLFDDVAIVAVPVVQIGDDRGESVVSLCTSTKGHVKYGLYALAAARVKQEFLEAIDDEGDDDE
jgi:hypothetical protein